MEQSLQLPINELKHSTDSIYQSTGESKNSSESTSPSDIRDNSDEIQRKTIGVTKTIKKLPIVKKRYDKINDELREKLIDAVENKNEKIKHVAKRLGINYSSAKSICQVYKTEGRTIRKTCKKRNNKSGSQQGSEYCGSNEVGNTRYHAIDPPCKTSIADLDQIKPEKDSLEILRDRLLKSRVSKSNTNKSPLSISVIQDKSYETKAVEMKQTLVSQSSIQALPQILILSEDQVRNIQNVGNQGQNLCSYAQILPENGLNTQFSYNSQNASQYNVSPQIMSNGFLIQNIALNRPQANFLNLADNTFNYNPSVSSNGFLGINQVLNQQQKVLPLFYENKQNFVLSQPLTHSLFENNGDKFIYLNGQTIDHAKLYLA